MREGSPEYKILKYAVLLNRPKDILFGEEVTPVLLEGHTYFKKTAGEHPVMVVHNKGATGLVFSDQKLYYSLLRPGIRNIFSPPLAGFANLEGHGLIQIGNPEVFWGVYRGHELSVGGDVKGLIRMGTAVADEEAVAFLNGMFHQLDP